MDNSQRDEADGGDFARACAAAREAVGTMRGLASASGRAGRLAADVESVAHLAREVDLVLALMSREVEKVSDDAPAGGLARRHGHRGAVDFMAAKLGASRAEANRLLSAGRALDDAAREPEPESAIQPPSPPRHPHVVDALSRHLISVECGTLLMSMLDELDASVPDDARERAERELVARAPGMSVGDFARVVRRFKARLEVDRVESETARMRGARTLRIWEDRDGMLAVEGRLDPETGAPLRAALDALVGDAMRRARENEGEDLRTTDQMRADALSRLARHALGCTATDLPLSTVTVVVRVQEKDLRDGLGLAEVDGCSRPVDVATLRRMAADADVVPAVLGGRGELLDLGRRRRLFTRAQRLALGERDGGCAFCGAPPAWTEVHHIGWWGRDRGRTDLANGVMLCSHCHHTIHDQGWEIRASATEVWFIPPSAVDPERRPRRGGRARFHAPGDLAPESGERGESGDSGESPPTRPASARACRESSAASTREPSAASTREPSAASTRDPAALEPPAHAPTSMRKRHEGRDILAKRSADRMAARL